MVTTSHRARALRFQISAWTFQVPSAAFSRGAGAYTKKRGNKKATATVRIKVLISILSLFCAWIVRIAG